MRVWCVYVSVGLHVEGKHNFLKSVLSVHFNVGFRDQTQFTRSVQQPPLHMEPSWIQFPQILMQEPRILHDYIGTQGWLGIMSVSTWKESSQSPPRHHSAMWYPKLSGCPAYCFAFHQTLSWRRELSSLPTKHQWEILFWLSNFQSMHTPPKHELISRRQVNHRAASFPSLDWQHEVRLSFSSFKNDCKLGNSFAYIINIRTALNLGLDDQSQYSV